MRARGTRLVSQKMSQAISEMLESRQLLAATLQGIPTWVEQGPGPIIGGQTQGLTDNPVTGAVEAIAVRPGDPSTVLIGSTEGGIWRTNNVNASPVVWTPLTDQMPSLAISSIAFSPFDASNRTLFAGVGNFSNGGNAGGANGGLYRSLNLGDTWQLVGGSSFTSSTRIRRVVPAVQSFSLNFRQHIVLVASNRGIFRSTNGGDSFTRITTTNTSDLVADPSSANRFFAAVPGTGLFRSIDFGLTWQPINGTISGLGSTNNIELAVHFNTSTNSRALYAGLVASSSLASVWRSADSGDNWAQIRNSPNVNPGGQGVRNFSIVADPTDPTIVYVGGDRQPTFPFVGNLFIGFSTLNSWAPIVGGGGANGTAPHADSRFMVFSGNDILESDDGGIYRLRNAVSGSRRWEPLVGNLRVAEIVSAAYDPVRNRLVAGAQDTGAFNQNASITDSQANRFRWNEMAFLIGDGAVVDVDTLNTFFGDPDPLRYASNQQFGGFQRVGGSDIPSLVQLNVNNTGLISRHLNDATLDGNDTPTFDSSLAFDNEFQINRVDTNRMLIGTTFLYESTNRGDNLTTLGGAPFHANNDGIDNDLDGTIDDDDEFIPPPGGFVGRVNSIAYGGRRGGSDIPNAAVVGTDGVGGSGFLRIRFVGTALPVVDNDYPGGAVTDLALDPEDCRKAWVLDSSNRVWLGTSVGLAGENWINLTGNLPPSPTVLTTIAVVGTGASAVPLVGGTAGVLRLDPNSSNNFWQEFGAGMPNVQVSDLRWDRTDDVLVAGTIGRGAWTIRNVSDFVDEDPILLVDGTSNDDFVAISLNPSNPLLLDVNFNGSFQSFQTSIIKRIVVNLHDGDDFLQLDSTGGPNDPQGVGGGPVVIPGGISYNGGNDTDGFLSLGNATLDEYDQEPGSAQMNNRITYATGQVLQVTLNATQQIFDDVVADNMSFTATVSQSELSVDDGSSVGDGRLRLNSRDVTAGITYAPIEFSGKTRVTIHADELIEIPFGSPDTITVANSELSDRPLLTGLVLDGGFGDDTINIARAPVATTVIGGDGADEINFGRGVIVGFFPNVTVASLLDGIDAPVSVSGGNGSDTLNLSATSPLVVGGFSGEITNSTVTGFGMANPGVSYSDVQVLNLTLGSTSDSVRVRSTPSGATTNIDTGGGNDFIRLGTVGTTSAASFSGNLNSINTLSVTAGAGSDTMVLDDSGDSASNTGTLTSASISGLGMGGPVNYNTLEALTVHLGSGGDTMLVRSLASTTSATINTNSGNDLVRFGSLGTTTAGAGGTVNAIDGPVSVNGGAGSNRLFFDDTGDTLANTVAVNTTSVAGLGMSAGVNFTLNTIQNVDVFTGSGDDTATNSVPSGQLPAVFFNLDGGGNDGIALDAGNGSDVIHVGWDFLPLPGIPCTREEAAADLVPHRDFAVIVVNGVEYRSEYADGETISIRAGNGADSIDTATVAGTKWRMNFDGDNGNDQLIGGNNNDRLDGGRGDDHLEGGGGDDILIAGPGSNVLVGGAGRDSFFARNGSVDRLIVDLDDILIDRDPNDVVVFA